MHLGDLTRPSTPAAEQMAAVLFAAREPIPVEPIALADSGAQGLIILSQTCDIVRDCRDRPYIEVAPLVEVSTEQVEAARRLKLPTFAYIPALAERRLVAHLDRVMTVEKSLVARWSRTPGWEQDEEARAFSQTLARKRARFAFPDDFTKAVRKLGARLTDKHEKHTDEGAYLRALGQIRVRAAPSWEGETAELQWWFIKNCEPDGVKQIDWHTTITRWMDLFEPGSRFTVTAVISCMLEDMTARDYVESDALEFDHMSTSRP